MDGLVPGRIVYFVFDKTAVETVLAAAAQRRHTNNPIVVGTIAPAMVVSVMDAGPSSLANLTVMLDGPDTHWATSVPYDADKRPGSWHWPAQATRYQPDRVAATPARTAKPAAKAKTKTRGSR